MRPIHAGLAGAALAGSSLVLAGCGSGAAAPTIPTIGAAKVTHLTGFQPAGPVVPEQKTGLSFTIAQPDGKAMTEFKEHNGPHSGVHVIVVSKNLDWIDHQHPKPGPDGKVAESITLPGPGKYRAVVDVYPKTGQPPNYQLFRWMTAKGAAPPAKLPPFKATQTAGGYTVTLKGKPSLKAIEAGFLDFDVKDSKGRPVEFQDYFGALAHAIFFREGTLDYFHTHVCAAGATGCTSALGATKVTGTSGTPGKLRVGVLVPVGGTWRLFLQFQPKGGKVISVPYTLKVAE